MERPHSTKRGTNLARFHADLDFHVKVMKSCFVHSIEAGDVKTAQQCYSQLISLHFKPEVSKDLLSFGTQLLKLSEPAEDIQFQTKELLQNLIALKGTHLQDYVRRLAEILLAENNRAEATALIKSKLSGKASRSLLDQLNLAT